MKTIRQLNAKQLRMLSFLVPVLITAFICGSIGLPIGAALRGEKRIEVPVTVTSMPTSVASPTLPATATPEKANVSLPVPSGAQLRCAALSGSINYGYFAVERLGLGDPNAIPGPFWLRNTDGSLERFERMNDMDFKVNGHTDICISQ